MSSVSLDFAPSTASSSTAAVETISGSEILRGLIKSKTPPLFYTKKIPANQLQKPYLSGKPGDFIDFSGDDDEIESTTTNGLNARKLLNSAKLSHCAPSSVSSAKSDASKTNALTNFKSEMQKKMKLQRDVGMNKREELYRKEMKDFNENFGVDDAYADDEDESETCSNVSEEPAEVGDEPEKEEIGEQDEVESVTESSDSQNLHLLLREDSERIPSYIDEVPMDDSSIAPYQKNGVVRRKSGDDTLISNGSNVFAFQPDGAQDELDGRLDVSAKFLSSSPTSNCHYYSDDEFSSNSTPKVNSIRRRTNDALKNLFNPDDDKDFSTQNLLDLCSGQFAAVRDEPESDVKEELEVVKTASIIVDDENCADEEVDCKASVDNEEENEKHAVSDEEISEVSLIDDEEEGYPAVVKCRPNVVVDEGDAVGVKRRRNVVIDDEDEIDVVAEKKFAVDEQESIDDEDAHDGLDTTDEEDAGIDEEDDEVAMFRKMDAHKFIGVKGKIRKEFIENEAELSGSEIGSDDEEDGSMDDFLEAEEGDLDQNLPDDDELKDQVGKIHNKQMLDDDKRRLILYKEAYLPDGELHSETDIGRRLRWRTNSDADINFGEEVADDDKNDDDDVAHCSHRVDDQRVMFLFDQKEKADDFDETDFGSFFPSLKSEKITIRRSISSTTSSSQSQQFEKEKTTNAVDYVFSENFDSTSRRDSFLSRSSTFLKKIVKENSDSNSATTSNFSKSLFTTIRSPDGSEKIASSEKTKRKLASNGVVDAQKRAKLPVERSNSIFEYL